MSIAGRTVSWSVAAATLAGVLAITGAVIAAVSTGEVREIRLVARDMAFYLESDPDTPNPTITVRAGERVRITLRNDERGFTHDFAAPALGASLDPLNWREHRGVTFEVPDEPGSHEYVCRPHRPMMRGTLIVTP